MLNSSEFNNRIALVTGAGSGIGFEASLRFLDLGCKLIVIDKNLTLFKDYIDGSQLSSRCHLFEVDLSDIQKTIIVFKKIIRKGLKITYAFNAAGIGGAFAPVENYPISDWVRVMEINLNAVFVCMQYELKLMKNSANAAIVNCSSLLSKVGYENDSAYVASKHGVIGLTKSAALEYAGKGIRINAISPGFTNTNMTSNYDDVVRKKLQSLHAMKRFASTKEIVDAVIWLCSANSSFVCGHNLVVDGGYTIQ